MRKPSPPLHEEWQVHKASKASSASERAASATVLARPSGKIEHPVNFPELDPQSARPPAWCPNSELQIS